MVQFVKIEGIPRVKAFLKKNKKEKLRKVNDSIHKAGFFVEGEVKQSIAGRRAETASVDTGRFLQSITTDNSKRFESKVFTKIPYAVFLEEGTRLIKPRRHFKNSLARNSKKINDFIKNSLK